MRNLLLLFIGWICLLLCTVGQLDTKEHGFMSDAEVCQKMADKSDADTDVLYDGDEMALLDMYQLQNDDLVPFRINQASRQLRILTSRVQCRCHTLLLLVKRLAQQLSHHLSTLVTHFATSYSTLKPLSWQYAADCYVFAFRQIII